MRTLLNLQYPIIGYGSDGDENLTCMSDHVQVKTEKQSDVHILAESGVCTGCNGPGPTSIGCFVAAGNKKTSSTLRSFYPIDNYYRPNGSDGDRTRDLRLDRPTC